MGRRPGGKNRSYTSIGGAQEPAAQTSAFPSAESTATEQTPPMAARISSDAKEKESILEAAKKVPEIFTAENVKWVFDAYLAILCFVYSIALKTEYSALQEELSFDEEQKNMLAEPLAKICSKYAPSSWAGMAPEIQLVSQMGIWTVASFQRAKNVARKEQEKKRDAERTQPISPIRNDARREVHVPA